MSQARDDSGGYIDAATSDNVPTNTINTGMFNLSPLFLKDSLIGGESGGIPGFESTSAAGQMPPPISSASPSWWDSIRNDMGQAVQAIENAPGTLYTDAVGITKTVYGDVSSGVGTVFNDVSAPIANAAQNYFWYAMVALVVVAGGLYFVGKGGAIKVNAIV